jgi:hypothetical protein
LVTAILAAGSTEIDGCAAVAELAAADVQRACFITGSSVLAACCQSGGVCGAVREEMAVVARKTMVVCCQCRAAEEEAQGE